MCARRTVSLCHRVLRGARGARAGHGKTPPALKAAIHRVKHAIIKGNGDGCGAPPKVPQPNTTDTVWIKECSITVRDAARPLGKGMDESYTLEISAAGVCRIVAPETWGAIHALESVAQLAGENCTMGNAPISISDKPRFGFRGQ